ncbi:hypothetical protein [Streptomyces stelliscabiei]|uniref:hypothetical protein n=1 Tax=Streptomyces stelliscabiei TaxID=146820 RepID=UPI0029B77BAD|nr:hypothetical protein [Streptomyces stelliscabiei]MDX2515959.1 hypothetical protein [Streptomyces stelliscabiei]MDX2549545.1 hypothetical protein [Streptomyces stelliscabiei]MDX2611567.1 hypothetical protein [Streptomyces stelliscabiei]MDX2634337.1 hypothetical protein [Streptomyces stelliscabiei]MDX2659283.1 hypothetical protein [Streptomyces stelliscabiei]
MHSEVRSLTLTPGTDARQQLTSKILATNELVQQAMERLAALDGSQYAAVPGSRPSLEALAASIAASDLASALEANPLEGAAFPGPPADEAAVRTARHTEAVPAMAEHLADAAHGLDLAYTGCYYLASGISRDLEQYAEQPQETPVPEITASQYAVLARLSAGGGTRYVISRHGVLKAIDKDRATVNVATLSALIKRELVEVDTTTPLHQGQRLHVTAEGRRALAQHKPTASARAAAVIPPATKQGVGRRR